MKRTVRELILEGRREKGPNQGIGLAGTLCTDSGAFVKVRVQGGVTGERSKRKGETYVIRDLVDCAPWNPNERRATLVVQYLKAPQDNVYTYLDERFNDEVKY